MQPPETRPPYASARNLLRETFDALLPPARITVAEHAERNRWMPSSSGVHLTRFDVSVAPYLTGPMEAWSAEQFDTVAVIGPAASGKTIIAENILLHTIDADPAALLWYLPTADLVDSYVKGRIDPMLEAHDRLIGDKRVSRDSIGFKRFTGGRAEFLHYTRSNLVNKHVRFIVADEYDAFDDQLGDPLTLLNPRRQAAGSDSRLLVISHPDRAAPLNAPRDQQRGIMALYADSDRRTWWWKCPHCGGYSSPNPGTPRHMTLTWPDDAAAEEVEAKARLVCPLAGCLIDEAERRAMLPTGRWVAQGEEIDEEGRITGAPVSRRTAGFWIVGAMSPFVRGGIGGLALAVEQAKREAAVSGEDRSLREAYVKGWGVPAPRLQQLGTIEAAALADRARPDLNLRQVPEGARVLTAAVDIQGNRFELLTRAWGPGMESWVIDARAIPADPATDSAAWDALLEHLAGLSYPLADGTGRHMKVRCAVFDAVGQPGVTEQAYAAWLRARRAGRVTRHGRINGRDAWSLLPARGASGLNAPRLVISYPDGARADRRAAAGGQVPLAVFNPNAAKDALAAQLARAEPGFRAVHFPAGLLSPAPPHAWFEQLAAERRDRRGAWAKAMPSARNEAWDLMVMAEIAARLHGLHRITDWSATPAWAADWDRNTAIFTPASAAGVSPPPPLPAPLPPARQAPVAAVAALPPPPVRLPPPAAAQGLGARLAARLAARA